MNPAGLRAPRVRIADFVATIGASVLAPWADLEPWALTAQSEAVVRMLLAALDPADYRVDHEVAVHRSARIEDGAILKGPLILGPHCTAAAGAYLRGGNWLAEGCSLGPGVELKSSFVFAGTRLAHFNFVGDAILGADVNLEAGSIVCNTRNEREDKEILVRNGGGLVRTGSSKFGALIGDGCRIGANAVLAPGALLAPGTIVPRAALLDDELPATP